MKKGAVYDKRTHEMGAISSDSAKFSKLRFIGFKVASDYIGQRILVKELCTYYVGSKVFLLRLIVDCFGNCVIDSYFLNDYGDFPSLKLTMHPSVHIDGYKTTENGVNLWIPELMFDFILNLYSIHDFVNIMGCFSGYLDSRMHDFYQNVLDFDGVLIGWR